jgi:hypothetical protein
MPSTATAVRQQQRKWAAGRNIRIDNAGYTEQLEDNLFQPLSPCAADEFEDGDGGELGGAGERGKMQALHSSSALACNFFDYWRGRDTAPLANALGVDAPLCSIRFEQKRPTGLRGKAPNLDVMICPASGPQLAIESKFLEPYGPPAKGGFKGKYFEGADATAGHWNTRGLAHCQRLAEEIHTGKKTFRWLNAEQLLKHTLGLSRTGDPWTLLYLWYEAPGEDSQAHRSDATEFGTIVRPDGIQFSCLSYQELFGRLETQVGQEHAGYMEYMRGRYFNQSNQLA